MTAQDPAGPGDHPDDFTDDAQPHEAASSTSESGSELPTDQELADLVALESVDGSVHAQVVAERDDYLDSLRRLQADFENYRKRSLREQEAAADRACEKVVNKLLPVLDTFELALAHESEPDASPLAKLHDTLLSALESEGLERLAPNGLPFDPQTAEAVVHEEGDGGEPVVVEVLRAGYGWRKRVIRPAMVKVKG